MNFVAAPITNDISFIGDSSENASKHVSPVKEDGVIRTEPQSNYEPPPDFPAWLDECFQDAV